MISNLGDKLEEDIKVGEKLIEKLKKDLIDKIKPLYDTKIENMQNKIKIEIDNLDATAKKLERMNRKIIWFLSIISVISIAALTIAIYNLYV